MYRCSAECDTKKKRLDEDVRNTGDLFLNWRCLRNARGLCYSCFLQAGLGELSSLLLRAVAKIRLDVAWKVIECSVAWANSIQRCNARVFLPGLCFEQLERSRRAHQSVHAVSRAGLDRKYGEMKGASCFENSRVCFQTIWDRGKDLCLTCSLSLRTLSASPLLIKAAASAIEDLRWEDGENNVIFCTYGIIFLFDFSSQEQKIFSFPKNYYYAPN